MSLLETAFTSQLASGTNDTTSTLDQEVKLITDFLAGKYVKIPPQMGTAKNRQILNLSREEATKQAMPPKAH